MNSWKVRLRDNRVPWALGLWAFSPGLADLGDAPMALMAWSFGTFLLLWTAYDHYRNRQVVAASVTGFITLLVTSYMSILYFFKEHLLAFYAELPDDVGAAFSAITDALGGVPLSTWAVLGVAIIWNGWTRVRQSRKHSEMAGRVVSGTNQTAGDAMPEPPVLEPPVALVLNPDRALPTALRSDESYGGMTIGAAREGGNVLLTVSNLSPSGTFAVRFQLVRIEGSIDTIGSATNFLSWAPPSGELFHPSQAEQVFPYCGLAYRDLGRIRFGLRERSAYSREVTLFCFALDERKRMMREMIRVESFAEQSLRIEVDVSVERVTFRTGGFCSGRRECHGRFSLSWDDESSEPLVTVHSIQDIVGYDDGELRSSGDAGETSDKRVAPQPEAKRSAISEPDTIQKVAEGQSDNVLPDRDFVRINSDVQDWANQLLASMSPTHQALRQVVIDFWGASSPEGQQEYQALQNTEQRLRNALENQARSEVIEEMAIAYYLGYRDYVDKIHSHVHEQQQRTSVIARSDYVQWEHQDDALTNLISVTTGGPGPINHFQAAVTKRGQRARL